MCWASGLWRDYDERLELAPRDIVSRSIVAEMRRTGSRHVFLDMTALDEAISSASDFRRSTKRADIFGLDIAKDHAAGLARVALLHGRDPHGPVRPLDGAGTLRRRRGSCTGVHGANRLASNSLLEGLVFGARAGEAAASDNSGYRFQIPNW